MYGFTFIMFESQSKVNIMALEWDWDVAEK